MRYTVVSQARYDKLVTRNLELEQLIIDYQHANGHLRRAVDKLRDDVAAVATERDAWKLNAELGNSPDLTAMHLDMIELERAADRARQAGHQSELGRLYLVEKVKDLETEIARLQSRLDNAHADNATQAAILRETHRSTPDTP